MSSFSGATAPARLAASRASSAARFLGVRAAFARVAPAAALLATGLLLACSEDSTEPIAVGGSGGAGSAGRSGGGQAGGGGAAGTATAGASTSGGGAGATTEPLVAHDFGEDVEGWTFVYADPPTLIAPVAPGGDAGVAPPAPENVATADHDTAGDPTGNAGSIRLELPFSGPSQKISFEVDVAMDDTGLDLAGRSISARVSVLSGYSADPMNPPGLKLYVKTGPTSLYADSGYINILPGSDWQTFAWPNISNAAYVDPAGPHTPTDVRQIGIEFDTGGAGVYAPATVLLDTVAVY